MKHNFKSLYQWCIENNSKLLEEWDYKKNTISPNDISYGTDTKYWWICSKCGNEWQARVGHRTTRHNGCKKCADKVRNINRKPFVQPRWKYTDEMIEALRKYYPIGDWDSIFKYIPNTSKTAIKGYANKHGIYVNKKDSLSEKDISGQKFNKLTAISFDHKEKNMVFWKCKCDCGNITVVDIYSLTKGITKSCGCLRHKQAVNAKDYTGMKFGMLTAVERLPRYRNNRTCYRCICECGRTDVIVDSGNLHSGHTISCGVMNHKKIEYKINKDLYDDTKRTYLVYRHIAPNGKSYIGITKQDTERRFQNGYGYKSQEVFWRAIKKYGWENFKHEVLEENLTEKEAGLREDYYIKEVYKTFAPKGYNVAEGGSICISKVKPIIQYYKNNPVNFFEGITEASKQLDIAQFTIRSHIGPEKTIGDYYFEILPPIHRYDIPDKYFDLINESHYSIRDVIARETSKQTIKRNLEGTKPINKYGLDGKYLCTYNRTSDIKKDLHREKIEGIKAAANPNRTGEVAYGYMWKYDTGDHSDISPLKYKNKRTILQIDLATGNVINEFPSIAKAAKETNYTVYEIGNSCKGKIKNNNKYIWKYK